MNRTWIGAVTLFFGLIGCGGGTTRVEHIWVQGANETVPAGVAACIEGPYQLPAGGSIEFDIMDTYGDDMDVSVVQDGDPCDGSTGFGKIVNTNWNDRITSDTGTLPSGLYSLAVTCYNLVDDCTPYLYSFGYLD